MIANATLTAKLCLATILALFATAHAKALPIWINEIHYDNLGGDQGEFVEIAGVAGTDLTDTFLELYNGNNGAKYGSTITLSGTLKDAGNGFGFLKFESTDFGANIQNGNPDGIGLSHGSEFLFLSYGGTFTASSGLLNGKSSTDIGVKESNSSTPLGHSLQLTGNGSTYSDFTWLGPIQNTRGFANVGQTFGVPDSASTLGLLSFALLTVAITKRRTTEFHES